MREKEKQLIAKIIEKQARLQQILYDYSDLIGSEIESELDDVFMFDYVLDYLGVPKDNTIEQGIEDKDIFCRDCYSDWLFEIKDFKDALCKVNNELIFLAQLIDCDGIANWREKYETTHPTAS